MKNLNYFSLTFIFSALLITSCTNTETNDSTLDTPIEEQIDTIPMEDDKQTIIMEDKNDDKAGKANSTNQVNANSETTNKPVKESSENPDPVKKETVKKPQPVKTKTYNFIVAGAGKQVEDDFKGDLMTDAATEVYIEKKGKCGNEDCGKKINLVNMNEYKSIEVAVQISWKENDKKIIKKRSYNLKSSQKLEIGCSSNCDAGETTIKWSIIGATYSN